MSAGRIFIVDDNPKNIGVLTGLLRDHGYEVRMATSGERALEALRKWRPDVVLLDIRMPGIDGLDLCLRLAESPATADLPVVFMSALDDLETRVKAFEHGGVDYVAKPFEEVEVLARIRRQVELSRVRAALEESEARLRAVTESAIDAIISADAAGHLRAWNRAAETLLGYTEAEVLGKSLELIIPDRHRRAHREGMERVNSGGESRIIGRTAEVSAIAKDGREVPIELSLAKWDLDGARYYTGILRDISERKEAERRLREYAEELERQHVALQRQHDALNRQQQALIASNRQADRLFSAVTAGLPGSVLNGQYALHEELATGGFGIVYRSTQVALERPVAVKVFKPPSAEEAEVFLERFRREGVSACRVTHENAVAVYDAGIADGGLPYLVMELLEGATVAERIKQNGPFRLRRALEILADVCAVLGAAHEAGIIHRDVKPSNVFLKRRRDVPGAGAGAGEVVKVLDFGIAKLMDDPGRLTLTHDGQILGTPTHMAPERLSGGDESDRSDVYSVAVMMYEMLTGRLPFPNPSKNVWSTVWMHVTSSPEPLDAIDPSLPSDVAALGLWALSKAPENRPGARELESKLRLLRAELGDETEPGEHRERVTLASLPASSSLDLEGPTSEQPLADRESDAAVAPEPDETLAQPVTGWAARSSQPPKLPADG